MLLSLALIESKFRFGLLFCCCFSLALIESKFRFCYFLFCFSLCIHLVLQFFKCRKYRFLTRRIRLDFLQSFIKSFLKAFRIQSPSFSSSSSFLFFFRATTFRKNTMTKATGRCCAINSGISVYECFYYSTFVVL